MTNTIPFSQILQLDPAALRERYQFLLRMPNDEVTEQHWHEFEFIDAVLTMWGEHPLTSIQ